jgi:hypothetical protein
MMDCRDESHSSSGSGLNAVTGCCDLRDECRVLSIRRANAIRSYQGVNWPDRLKHRRSNPIVTNTAVPKAPPKITNSSSNS